MYFRFLILLSSLSQHLGPFEYILVASIHVDGIEDEYPERSKIPVLSNLGHCLSHENLFVGINTRLSDPKFDVFYAVMSPLMHNAHDSPKKA